MGKNKIYLTVNGELIKTDLDTAEILNTFFSNIVEYLDIGRHSNNEAFLDNESNCKIQKSPPSIVAIRNKCKNEASVSFAEVDKKDIEHLILNEDVNKGS